MEDFSKYNGEGTTLRKAQMRLLEMLVEVDRICEKHNITYWIDGGTPLGAVRHGGFIPWDDDIDIAVFRKDYPKLIKILENELPERFALQNHLNEKFYHHMFAKVIDKNSFADSGMSWPKYRSNMKHKGLFLDIFYVEKGFLPIKKIITNVYYKTFFNKRNHGDNKFKKIISVIIWPFISLVVFLLRLFSFIIPNNYLIFGYGIPYMREFRKDEIMPTKKVKFEGYKVMGPYQVDKYLKRYFGDYMKLPPEEQRVNHFKKIEIYDNK